MLLPEDKKSYMIKKNCCYDTRTTEW